MQTLERVLSTITTTQSSTLRWGYVIGCICISASVLGSFAQIVERHLAISYSFQTEVFVVTAQVGFQWLFMGSSTWAERIRYSIIALSVSMIGSLMLLPLILYHYLQGASEMVAIVYFFIVVGMIFIVHHRMIITTSLPRVLSFTWVLYRLLLLIFVLVRR